MSATNRGTARVELDFYGTPDWATFAILRRLQIPQNARILEPGCGDGAIFDELWRWDYRDVTGVELDPIRSTKARVKGYNVVEANFLDPAKSFGTYDFVIGNPPYSLAMDFVLRALEHVSPGGRVAMLLRLNWLSSMVRADFHRAKPAHVHVLPKRPSFTGDGKTDATEYGWFVWGREGSGHVPGKWEVLALP